MVYDYEREVRTANSEAFLILDGEDVVGESTPIFCPARPTFPLRSNSASRRNKIEEIISDIDSDMLNTVGTERDTHLYHVFQGTEIRVFSDGGYEEYGGNGNGHGHGPLPPPAGSG